MKERRFAVIATILSIPILYYIILPPLNTSAPLFWIYLLIVSMVYIFANAINSVTIDNNIIITNKTKLIKKKLISFYLIIPGIFAVITIINLFNMPIFNSKSYYNRIFINEDGVFEKDIPEVDFKSIPLLDKDSSQKLGDRVMGQMTELVSQFRVSDLYTQINYNNDIVRVTPLEYANAIKYFTNRKGGVKGYIILNSVTGKAELVKLDKGMKYMPSAYFNENLNRKLRFSHPTEIFGEATFEIDNDGKPYWVVPTLKYGGVGLKKEVKGVVILDPVNGKTKNYDSKDIPTWVDHAYSAELIIEQVNDWGAYSNGFLNSIFGQKGMVATTEGYNYLILNDDVYMYTGITSVGSDESNIGFILSNLRTKETNFYSVSGAEEFSAMASAEGQVQQMNYNSSFPLLINLNNKPTYLMSLKDRAGLVKMYAFVDVVDYQKVVVTDVKYGIEAASKNYLGDDKIEVPNDKQKEKDITIKSLRTAMIDGTSIYYLIDKDNDFYKLSIKVKPDYIPFIDVGDTISIKYSEDENINKIIEIKN